MDVKDQVWRVYRPGTMVRCNRRWEFFGVTMTIEEVLGDHYDGHCLYWCHFFDERGVSRHCELERCEFTPLRKPGNHGRRVLITDQSFSKGIS